MRDFSVMGGGGFGGEGLRGAVLLEEGLEGEGFGDEGLGREGPDVGKVEVSFFSKKLSLLFLFLFIVEGLFFFFVCLLLVSRGACVSRGGHFTQVSMLKEKEEPMVMVREVVWPWDASAWQKSRHFAAKSMSLILVVILSEL